jgi:hypothetical protein
LFQGRNFHILHLKSSYVVLQFFPSRLAWILCFIFSAWSFSPAGAQFKKVYEPDTLVLLPPSNYTAVKVMETDIPGSELAVVGTLTTQDSGGTYRLSCYTMLTDLQGNSQAFHLFEDTSAFVFQGPKAYGACYNGNGEIYIALGTNGAQVILKTTTSGQMVWARTALHHEFFSLVCDGGSVVALGQDESIQGGHDNALERLNTDGSLVNANMYGTPDFENPQKVAKIGGNYLVVGNYFQSGTFQATVVKADSGLNLIWGKCYAAPNKSTLGHAVVRPRDGNGYMVSGVARGGVDSLFLLKVDAAGTPVWSKFYGITGASEATNFAMAVDPETGGYLLTGSYRQTGYLRPYILMTDSVGNVQWARDYGEPGVDTDEFLNDVIYCQADGYFYAVGDRVEIDSNQFLHKVFTVKIAADSGTVPCDSALQVTAAASTFQIGSSMVEEPFAANNPYPMGNFISVQALVETRCSVLVGTADDLPRTGIFHFTNPSPAVLNLKVEVPMGGAVLRVVSLQGEVVLERRMEEGMQANSYSLPQISKGLYLVTMEGDGWRYPTRRWAVMGD